MQFILPLLLLGELCSADIDAITNWKLELTVEDGDLLTESGKDELRQMGQRSKVRFPDLLDTFNEEEIIVMFLIIFSNYFLDQFLLQFRTTIRQRAMESGKAFSEGAFPGEEVLIPEPLEDDMLLRVFL